MHNLPPIKYKLYTVQPVCCQIAASSWQLACEMCMAEV
jgi:hypothetical protein